MAIWLVKSAQKVERIVEQLKKLQQFVCEYFNSVISTLIFAYGERVACRWITRQQELKDIKKRILAAIYIDAKFKR